ncbi:hypothetical protein D9619_003521 [Psilocybe cf. subviscida]|uniref:SP-RING-type domain-containing protein n=1 Tax=Psilocybe cf. subviscida TaxID=2480587 RepID=A0A8H5EV36_9AGAR|nr:hypothetical protein D9619_003521 [Psilocybe cf. subviscida]
MATTGTWMDFDQIRHNIKNNTVDRLKQIITGLNEQCGTHFARTGKKQDIIDRIVATLDQWRVQNSEDLFMKAKGIIYQIRNTGVYSASRTANFGIPTAPAATSSHAVYDAPKPTFYTPPTMPSSSTSQHIYDPYAPRRPAPTVSAPAPSLPKPAIRFKDSPYFSIDQVITNVVECPESTSAQDRRQQHLNFTLTNDVVSKMRTPGSPFQLRLFCTSSIFYAGNNSFRSNTLPCPIEFPPTCEVRVNNTQITANLKGLKKKPGTAPPPDISKYTRLSTNNKVDMVYVNSQVPKYFMVVMLVEAIPMDTIISNLKSQRTWNAENVKQRMIQAMTEDDDIVAGPQKMSLKCPLTFVRISTPARSSKCVHPQCFDATSWFTMMEQTTTYLCPVCERVLDHKDLIVDGYFDEILHQTPDSVEDVMVEADAQWHTTDNKYGSAEWMAAYPPVKSESPSKKLPTPAASCPPTDGGKHPDQKPNVEILVLDSDDESDEEGRVKRELSPSYSSTNQSYDGSLPLLTHPPQRAESSNNVIDLTLSDSEDEAPPPPRRPEPQHQPSNAQGKRKASEAEVGLEYPSGDQSWKRGRTEAADEPTSGLALPQGGTRLPSIATLPNGGPPPPMSASSSSSSLSAQLGSFVNRTLPKPVQTYPPYAARSNANGINGINGLPPPPPPPPYRPSTQDARWRT